MQDEARINELLSLWQRLREEGQTASMAELCRDRPDLLPEIERRIQAVDALNRLADSIGQDTTLPSDASASSHSAPDGHPRTGTASASWTTLCIPGYEILG